MKNRSAQSRRRPVSIQEFFTLALPGNYQKYKVMYFYDREGVVAVVKVLSIILQVFFSGEGGVFLA